MRGSRVGVRASNSFEVRIGDSIAIASRALAGGRVSHHLSLLESGLVRANSAIERAGGRHLRQIAT